MGFAKYWPVALVGLGFVLLILAGTRQPDAESGDFPERPVKMVIGFAAGGSQDLSGRALAKELQEILGQPVPVVNQPGAASMLAAHNVAKSRPDGYTVWFGSAGTLVLKTELQQTGVDFFEDFELIGLVGKVVPALGVPADSPFKTVRDIIETASERPGELRWSHNGRGAAFMAMGMSFVVANDLDVVDVPFQSAKGMQLALFAGQVDFGMLNESDRLRFGDEKMKILASMRSSPDGALDPDLPTLGELGIPFVEIESPVGVMVPKATPREVVTVLQDAVALAFAREEFQETMTRLYIPTVYLDTDDGSRLVSDIRDNVQKILPALNTRPGSEGAMTGALMAPLAIGLFLVILMGYQAYGFVRSRNKGTTAVGKTGPSAGHMLEESFAPRSLLRYSGPLFLLMCAYGVLHTWFGYLIATAVSAYAAFALFGNRLNTVLLHGSVGAIVLYYVFVNLLSIYDPPGTVLDVSGVFR